MMFIITNGKAKHDIAVSLLSSQRLKSNS